MVMKADRNGAASSFTTRPKRDAQKTNHPKAQKKASPKQNTLTKIIRSKLKHGIVELTAKSNINGNDHAFYVRFPEALLNDTKINEKIPKDRLDQVEVRLDNPNEFRTLITLTRALHKTSLDSLKVVLALVVENVVDQYRGVTALTRLHQAQT